MKYLHLFPNDENAKFSKSFINFIINDFNKEEHMFLIRGDSIGPELSEIKYIKFNFKSFIIFLKYASKSEKIILHSLTPFYILMFALFPYLLKKTFWVIWGGDLYYYQNRKINLRTNFYEKLRRYVIKNLNGLITQLHGDYKLAQKWYGAKGRYYYSFVYPSNLYNDIDISKLNKKQNKLYIQVGNSACPTNEHIEVFEKLSKFKDLNINIICPLSYSGPQEYIDKVISRGQEIFGEDRFSPIVNFMPYEKYLELLGEVDVAIFNHKRQRGIGNITTLLGLGKKVYIREEITTWDFCEEHGLKVYNATNNFEDLLDKIDDSSKLENIENVKKYFSKEKLKADLDFIFKEA